MNVPVVSPLLVFRPHDDSPESLSSVKDPAAVAHVCEPECFTASVKRGLASRDRHCSRLTVNKPRFTLHVVCTSD